MSDPAFFGLVGANPAGTVLRNLQTAPAGVKASLEAALNSALKSKLSATLTTANLPALAALVEKMPSVNIAVASDFSVPVFLGHLASVTNKDPAQQKVIDEEIGRLATTDTVGSLVAVDQPLQTHPDLGPDAVKASIVSLLATSPTLGANHDLQADFVNRYAASDGSIQDFWQPLSADPKFQAAIPELQLTLELGVVTQNNPALLAAVRQKYQPASVRDLVKLSASDWAQLITDSHIPVPASTPGASAAAAAANYVTGIMDTLRSQYAGDYLRQGLAQHPLDAIDGQVAQFLKNVPDFDFIKTPVTSGLAKSAKALAGIAEADQPKVIGRIKGYQRLARLSPDFDVMSTLMARGLDSSYKIAQTPRAAFVQQTSQALGGSSKAAALHASAKGATAAALNFYQSVREGLNKHQPQVFGDVSTEVAAAVQQIPDWQELFGPTSACACQDCKSVLSAAAYLADLLHFLAQASINPATPFSPTLLSVLSGRRPDLVNLKLDCENTNTTLPYLDLVNEILESVVVSKFGQLPALPAYNTPADATSDELQVNPEFTKEAAYIPLENTFYPFNLPFDRFFSTTRTYLEFLGSSLYEVMKTFQAGIDPAVPANSNPNPAPGSDTIAQEYLKISARESLILTGQPFRGTSPLTNPSDLSEYYGYQPGAAGGSANIIAAPYGAVRTSNTVTVTTAGPHGLALGQLVTIAGVTDVNFNGTFAITGVPSTTALTFSQALSDASSGGGTAAATPWYLDLAYVPEFLKRTGVAYDDLVSLLETHFLNPGQSIALQVTDAQNPCDIDSAVINGLAPSNADGVDYSALHKIYRFIRLYTKLGWQISELDKAIMALGAADIDSPLLRSLSEAKQLQSRWNSSPLETLALWANLDTEGSGSLYISSFQNRGTLNAVDPGLALRYTAALPANSTLNLAFLNAYGAQISWKAGQLQFTDGNGNAATMTSNQERFLLSLASDTDYQQAVVQLFLQNPAPLASLPAGLVLPTQLPGAIYYQGMQLYFLGEMPDDLRTQLKYSSSDAGYQLAIDNLYEMRWAPGTEVAIATQTLASQAGQLVPAQTIPAHAGTVAASLRLSAPDLAAIVTYLWGQSASSQPVTIPSSLGGALAGGTYYIVVSAVSAFGEYLCTGESPAVTVTGSSSSITVTWTPVPGATSYNVYYTSANAGRGGESLRVSSATASVTLTTTAGGTVSSATPPSIPPLALNLANLSAVYRYARLAQALGISAPDLLSLIALIGIDPFQPSTQTFPGTVQFVEKAQKVLASQFSIAELDYIYRNIASPSVGPQQAALSQLVVSLQSGLTAPPAESSSASDPAGTLLQVYLAKVLAASDVTQLMGLIRGTFSYAAPLASLPAISFPSTLSLVAFDPTNHQLVCTGPMSQPQETQLLALSNDPAYQTAIQALYQSSLPAWTKVYTSAASATALPVVTFPPALTGVIAYTNGNRQLTFTGPMSSEQSGQLAPLSSDANYQSAISNLFAQSAPAWTATLSQPLNALPPITFPDSLALRLQFAGGNLRIAGPLSGADEAALFSLSADSAYQAAIERLYSQPRDFLVGKLYFLDTPSLMALLTNNSAAALPDKYGFVLNALLKAIGLVVQTVSDSLKLDAALTRLLLVGGPGSSDPALLKSTINPNLSGIADFLALVGNGVLGSYFPNPNFGGAVVQPAIVEPGIDFAWSPTSGPAPGLASDAFSAKWAGQLLCQSTGTYTFSVRVVPSSQDVLPFGAPPVVLSLRGVALPLTLVPAAGTGGNPSGPASPAIEFTASADLVAGQLTPLALAYPNMAGSTLTSLRLSWSSLSVPKTAIPQHQLYAASSFTLDAPTATYKLACRVALLLNTFKSTTSDLAYLAGNAAGFAGVDPADPTQTVPFNLNALPANPWAYSPALFNQWERLWALFNLRDSLPGGDAALLAIFAAARATPARPVSALIAPIVAATGWNASEVGLLLGSQTDPLTAGTLGFGLSAGDFTDERWLVRLQACLALAARFGAYSKQLFEWAALGTNPAGTVTTNGAAVTWVSGTKFSSAWGWATIYINGVAYSVQSASSNSLTLTSSAGVQATAVPYSVTGFVSPFETNVARDIQAAVKAQYNDKTWIQVGNALNDKLRESSRDALVTYILANAANWELTIHNAPVATTDHLYEYFLIDVEMGSCMQTSRVVQAAATVQLFVQRCLMNLEPDVPPATIDTEAWSWMQNYRVWQANREVFLFPENYMDPTLRDDKTPFFKELETELRQNPLTPAAAQQALIDYLEKVDQVARLDIRAMYWNYDANSQNAPDGSADSSNDVLHVFGRTPSTPNIYYYRRLLKASQYGQPNSPASWTAWEKVNVDIQGEQLVPVVWDGRLYVFWPIFAESSDPTQQPPQNAAPPQKMLKIQMAWSRYSQGGWSAKQVSSDSLVPQFYLTSLNQFSSSYTGAPIESLFFFSSGQSPFGDLVVRVWTPKWKNQYYGPGNAIPGQGTAPAAAQTDAVFEGGFVFTGCSSDGTVAYTDPISNWAQNTTVFIGGDFPANCQFESDTVDLIKGASKLSFWSGNLTGPLQYVDFLTRTPSPFRLAQTDPGQFFQARQPFVYQDASRAYFVAPMGQTYLTYFYLISLRFINFWHPHSCAFIKTLNQYGLTSFLSLLTQQRTNDGGVASGLVLSTSGTLTPGITPGTLYTQGQLYEAVVAPALPAMPPSSTQQLYCGPGGNFYYSPQQAVTPGDALIGSVVSNATSVTSVTQAAALAQPTVFAETYAPNPGGWPLLFGGTLPYLSGPSPLENVDFSYEGAYSIYNWELFFHIPLMMATLFSQDQQFAEAQKWFHHIFNPTTNSNQPVPQRFWNFLPFYECSASDEIAGPVETLFRQQLNSGLLAFQGALYTFSKQVNRVTGPTFDSTWVGATIHIPILGGELTFTVVSVQSSTSLTVSDSYWVGDYQYYVTFSPGPSECGQDVQSQVAAWQAQPFDPFLLGRLRTIAFRKMVVMKYVDNLIGWGDFLFAQNTRESINEATQLYILAQQILGDKPATIPPAGEVAAYSYNGLLAQASAQGSGGLDDFSNVLVTLENMFPFSSGSSPWLGNSSTGPVNSVAASSFYFCIPQNDQLLGYWDTVADRLYKIRHCMSLGGQTEQLALFAPPINPALLVKAVAAGVDLSSVLNDINSPISNYRYTFVLQKALEMCAEVRALGASLLAALEKNDAEALSALRSTQEVSLLQAVLQVKQAQIDEANKNVAGLQMSYAVTQFRQQYYQSLVTAGLSAFEQNQVSSLTNAQSYQSQSQNYEIASGLAGMLPNLTVGSSGYMGSPVATATFGGIDLQAILAAQSRSLAAVASASSYSANMMGLTGGWDRRAQDWNFQQQLAAKELTQIQSQIDAATLRVQIAQNDLQNQQLQISNAQAVLDFLNTKYTSQELYGWMISQLSAAYFQCYQMAYGLAKRAESCFRFELGLENSNFVQFGYWDSMRKGLLAGEGLYCDLKRMELAYLDQNRREFEITKYLSLVLLDPLAVITLKETGRCLVSLPEALFDMDYPGHYMRRIKSVSMTIPCVAGPYTSINCEITLVSNQIRIDNVANSPQDYAQGSHFITNLAATQSIATSSAQNDNGMFELNFRDERYLPFEGAGVISQWSIELPQDCNAFDFETISDMVINLKYTARDGGDALKAVAKQAAVLPGPATQLPATEGVVSLPGQNNLVRFFSLRHEFPTEWYKFLNPLAADTVQTMRLALSRERFPFRYRGKKIGVSQVDLVLKMKDINNPQRFKTGTPLGDFGTSGLLNVYLTPAAVTPRSQPQAPTQPAPNAQPIVLKSTSVILDGAPYGTGPVIAGTGLLWLQVFTSDAKIGNIASTLLDGNHHLLAEAIEDVFMVCHYSTA